MTLFFTPHIYTEVSLLPPSYIGRICFLPAGPHFDLDSYLQVIKTQSSTPAFSAREQTDPIDFLPSAVRRRCLNAALQGCSVSPTSPVDGGCRFALTDLINNNATPPRNSGLGFLNAQAPLRSQFGSCARSLPCRDSQNDGAE